jgi:hypothetical protein
MRAYSTFDTLVYDEEIVGGYSFYTPPPSGYRCGCPGNTCSICCSPGGTKRPQRHVASCLWHTACELCSTLESNRSSSS